MATKDQQRVAGKWRACHPPSNFHKGKVFIRPEGSELLIATVSAELRIPESIYASRLMAAAPELLTALNHCRMALRSLPAANRGEQSIKDAAENVISAAIAKAEGRS